VGENVLEITVFSHVLETPLAIFASKYGDFTYTGVFY